MTTSPWRAAMNTRGESPAASVVGRRTVRSKASQRVVSRANRRKAAEIFVAASKKTGQPVPAYIQAIADGR
jgi:hypothetical protein